MIRFYREDIKKELLRMINRDSNKVYVVSIAQGNPENCSITWRDIVKKKNKYFHPKGGKGYIKNPPNYIAFRYDGRLQSIHISPAAFIIQYDTAFDPEYPVKE